MVSQKTKMGGFYITFEKGSVFKQLIELCKDIVSDVNFQIFEDGIHMQAMDMAHVSLINLFLSKDFFKLYNVFSPLTIALSLKSLSTILKFYKDDYQLSLSCNSDNPETLDIIFFRKMNSSEENDQQYTFQLNLMSIEQEYLSIPEEEFDCSITMKSNDLLESIKNISNIGDSLKIKTIGKLVEFHAKGEIGNVIMCQSFTKDNMKFNPQKGNCNYSLDLNIRYLQNFCKSSFFSENVKLNIRQEQPLQLRYETKDASFLEFYLAPKMEDE